MAGKQDFRVNLLKSLITNSLAIDGSCIIIEPALRATSRELLEVREGLLKEGLHIYSPCLMNDPCPALVKFPFASGKTGEVCPKKGKILTGCLK